MKPMLDTRHSPIAGQWYPGDPKHLASSVDKYIQSAQLPQLKGDVIAIMAPHAGYVYSGAVAGYAFAAVKGLSPEIVAVVSPMHQPYPQRLLTTSHQAYETPIGVIPVATNAVQALDAALNDQLGFGLTAIRHDPEHSLEIELPFLQRCFPGGFLLLPIMVRDVQPKVMQTLGIALARVLRQHKTLLVASTDLSHFYPQAIAEKLDAEVLRRVEAFDPEGVLLAEEEGKGFACGRGALAAVLWAAKELGADSVQVLKHATSAEITGDHSEVVGYGAAVVTRTRS